MRTRPAKAVEGRGDRRKRETRERLLQAAFRLIAARGADAVAIQEITEAADVGFGSFYNHFASKEAIREAVIDAFFGEFGGSLDRLTAGLEDPAEVVAVCVRHTILRSAREPSWGQFLVREGFSRDALSRGLGPRLMRDIERGVASGRFAVPDLPMAWIAAGGTVLAAIAAQQTGELGALGLAPGALPERAATTLLQGLGLGFDEARGVARRPLPAVSA